MSESITELVLATGNPNKVAELAQLLGGRWSIKRRPEDLAETIEDGATLYENAAKKAREVHMATGSACLADDTGLFVAALGGRPGVFSARYAGPNADSADNVRLLLSELSGADDRTAYFETVLVLLDARGHETVVNGRCEGVIAEVSTGRAGFGYDPVFVPFDGDGRSFAEMTADEKNTFSHRGRALRTLRQELV